jgi:hypothetical protein
MVAGKEYSTVMTKRNGAAFLYIKPISVTQVKIRFVIGDATYNQVITFVYKVVGYGAKRLFKCDCGYTPKFLFFKNSRFACRYCQKLFYDIKNLPKGSLAYRINRYEKLAELKSQVKMLFRHGQYTSKAKKVMALAAKLR